MKTITEEETTLKRLHKSDEKRGLDPKVTLLRQKLAQKAQGDPKFKFYSLYSLICRKDVLKTAWILVKRNKGSPGVDNLGLEEIEQQPGGVEAFLDTIQIELQNKAYKPKPIRRVYIPKGDGTKRPLGIPTIKDRVVQMSVTLILEPIFETDFLACSYGFRPGISAHEGIKEIVGEIKQGRTTIYDADIKGYFDSIPHDKLIACVRMRITDGSVIELIRKWLKAPIIETPQSKGEEPTITHPKLGTPQGGIISPLLANLYLHWFDVVFHRAGGPVEQIDARLIRFADDFLVLMRYRSIQVEEFIRGKIEDWMGLRLNTKKTKVANLKQNGNTIDFLGFNLGYAPSKYGRYLKVQPKKQAFEKAKGEIRNIINAKKTMKPIQELIGEVNSFLRGWGEYFSLGHPFKIFAKMDYFVQMRLYRHLRKRSQRGYKKSETKTWYQVFKGMGLIRLTDKCIISRKAVCRKSARTV